MEVDNDYSSLVHQHGIKLPPDIAGAMIEPRSPNAFEDAVDAFESGGSRRELVTRGCLRSD